MSRIRILAIVLVLSSVALAGRQAPPGPPASPQRPDPQMPPITFRSEVNYVEVDAVVRDAQGNFVRDLSQGDFQVLEDGVPQAVTAFSLIDIPVTLSDRALFLPQDIEPDVMSNAAGPEGRLYVLLLDDIHTAAQRSPRVRQVARQFIEKYLGANDLLAVIHTSGRSDASQDFTNSRRLLTQAADKFMGQKLRSAYLNKLDAYNNARGSGLPPTLTDPEQAQRLYNARTTLSTVRSLSDWMAGVRGRRKAVVLIGEGIDFSIWDTMALSGTDAMTRRGDGAVLIREMQDAVAAATRANVNIYAVDPRGLSTMGDEAMEATAVPTNEVLDGTMTALYDELRTSQDSLRTLSEETGGFASVTSNDFGTAFQRIVDANSSYYVLGYYATNEKRDGRYRRIEVTLSRPGLTVNARKGYMAPRGKPASDKKVEASAGTSKELRETLNSPLQVSALKLAVFAAPLKGPSPKAAVAIVTQFPSRRARLRGKGRQVHQCDRDVLRRDQQAGQGGGREPGFRRHVAEARHLRARPAGRIPRPGAARGAARDLSAACGGARPRRQDRVGPLRPGRAGLRERTALRQRPDPVVGGLRGRAHGRRHPGARRRAAGAADNGASVLDPGRDRGARRGVRQPGCAAPLGRHHGHAQGGGQGAGVRQLGAEVEQGTRRRAGAATATPPRIPLKDLAPGLYVLAIEAKSSLGGTAPAAREVQIRDCVAEEYERKTPAPPGTGVCHPRGIAPD